MCSVLLIQKLDFYYGYIVHNMRRTLFLESEISAMLVTDEHLLTVHRNRQLQMINPDTVHTMRQMKGHTGHINCIVYCPELSRVITGSRDGTARVWDAATGECVHVLEGHMESVYCAAVHGTTYVH